MNNEEDNIELLTSVINFINTDAGKYMINMLNQGKTNRLNDLVYSNGDDTLTYQGEVRAYNDIINFLSENALKNVREQLANKSNI